jgi:hypothetical protein
VSALVAFVDVSSEGAYSADLKGAQGTKLVDGKIMDGPVRVAVATEYLPDFDNGLRDVEGTGDSD